MKHNAADFYEHNPLVTGVFGLALGALLGSSLPLSDTERDALGDIAGSAAEKTADLAEQGAQNLQQHAQSVH
jgi:hypothetical protein